MKKAFVQLHIAVFLAGFTGILGRLITLNEGLLVWYRMAITSVTLALLLYSRNQLILLPFRQSIKLFSIGGVIALHWVTFYGSIKYANVSVALTCFSTIGFFTALFEPLILKRSFDMVEMLLGLLAIAGIYLIFDFYPQYKLGILLGIICALLAAIFSILNKEQLKAHTPETVTLYEMFGGGLILTAIIPFYLQFFPGNYYLPSASDWMWLLVLAWLCTVYSFILQLNALKRISPFTANLSYNLEPVYGILLACLLFGENKFFGAGFYYGIALILLAVIMQTGRVFLVRRMGKG